MRFFQKSTLNLAAGLAVAALFLAVACGAGAPAEPASQDSATPDSAPASAAESVVAVSFANDKMDPEVIQVNQGDEVTLDLESDRPGSFHIHGYDLQQEVVVGEVRQFRFLANATGRFRINFHGEAPSANKAEGAAESSGQADHHHSPGVAPMEAAAPVSVDFSTELGDEGGVHFAINTEGWRWAPEEVNREDSAGAGHAHIYADGIKLGRVYGPYHYLPHLPPGPQEVRVALNTNTHKDIAWQGSVVESIKSVTVPDATSGASAPSATAPEPVVSSAPMSLDLVVHEDELGGYNLETSVQGFEFAHGANLPHQTGRGYALLAVNGNDLTRVYVPWLNVPAQGEGSHTFTVTLVNNEGRPYYYNGAPVEASQQVLEPAKEQESGANTAASATGQSDAATSHSHGSGSGTDHHAQGSAGTAGVEELEIGYLEVLP